MSKTTCVQTSIDAQRFGLPSWHIILAASILSGVLDIVLIIINTQIIAGCCLLAFPRTAYPAFHPLPGITINIITAGRDEFEAANAIEHFFHTITVRYKGDEHYDERINHFKKIWS